MDDNNERHGGLLMLPQKSEQNTPTEPVKSPALHVVNPQRMDRTKYIGGTDAAAICGLSQWKTPIQVWALKTGKIQEEDISDKLPVKLGIKLEQTVCELFMEETGKKLHRVNETLFHPKHKFIGANIDRRVVGENAIFEAKTCSAYKDKEWANGEIPADYILQCHHYLMVTGAERCFLAVLIGNHDFQIRIIERDEKVMASLLEREVLFWKDYVEADIMPWVVTHRDGDTISQLYPVADDAKEITLGDDANKLVENLKAFEADQKNLDNMIEQHKNELKLLLGDAIQGSTGINRVRWINSKQSRLDGKSLLEKYPDIHKEFYSSSPVRRFSYGAIKKEKEG